MRKLVLVLALLVAPVLLANDLELVRENFVGYYTATDADRATPRVAEALAGLEAHARDITRPDFMRDDGGWNDINYSETPSGSWSPWDHTRRLIVMARAYRTPGQALYGDERLRGQIQAAIAYTSVFYGRNRLPNGNWWFWTLGIPLDLGPTLVLMEGYVDQGIIDDAASAIALRIGSSPTSRGIVGPVPTGENLVWSSFTHLSLALLRDDTSRLGKVRDAMASVTLPNAGGEGIKPDRSFQQHGAQLYTGGYGGAFANDVARYALIARRTSYELPEGSLGSFADYVADGIAWALRGDNFDVSVVGRDVARPTTSGYNGLAALLQMAIVPSARQAEIQAAAKLMASAWGGLPVELAGVADVVSRMPVAPSGPVGHRHYYQSDYTVHRRDGWFASIKMFSKRTKSGERTNNENLLGSRQSDGRLHLAIDGNEYYRGGVRPALDWSRLPGITVEQRPEAADDTYGYGSNTIAGGVSDGMNGVSAMHVAPLGSTMWARKAWFFFDDAIVFLTSGITSIGGHRVETVLNQWPVENAAAPIAFRREGENVKWALSDGIGYYFPQPAALQTKVEERSGTWAALGASPDTSTQTATFATFWLDHGVNPMSQSAEYVLLPRASEATLRAWEMSEPIAIERNDSTAAVVRDRRTGARGFVFWTAGDADGVSASAPAIIYMTGTSSNLRLDIADPQAGTSGVIRITVPGRYLAAGARITAGDAWSTTIEVPKSGGANVTAFLTEVATYKRRGAR